MVTVAIVGTGRMGSAMARALASFGDVELVLHNRTTERAAALSGDVGGRVVESAAQAAGAADVCITMLADEPAVVAAWEGPQGVLAGARPGSVLVDMSTVPPGVLRRFEGRARSAGAGILDAPVSGSVSLAESGQLTIMAGGEAADLERARPVFDVLAQQVFHLGPLGSGAAMKLAVNAVIFALNNALSEALVLAERTGIDRSLAYEVLASSAVGAPFVSYKRAAFLDPASSPVAFALELAGKDLRLISELAASVDLQAPQLRANVELIEAAATAIGPDHDFAEVATYLRQDAKGGRQAS